MSGSRRRVRGPDRRQRDPGLVLSSRSDGPHTLRCAVRSGHRGVMPCGALQTMEVSGTGARHGARVSLPSERKAASPQCGVQPRTGTARSPPQARAPPRGPFCAPREQRRGRHFPKQAARQRRGGPSLTGGMGHVRQGPPQKARTRQTASPIHTQSMRRVHHERVSPEHALSTAVPSYRHPRPRQPYRCVSSHGDSASQHL